MTALTLEQYTTTFDRNDAPFIEHSNEPVARLMWMESGIAIDYHDGSTNIVDEYTKVICGEAMVVVTDLHLTFGVWVDAKRARLG